MVRQGKDHMEILDRQQFISARLHPLGSRCGLAFRAMAITTSNGDLSITCLMGSTITNGARSKDRTPVRLPIKIYPPWPSASQSVCPWAETIPFAGAVARWLRWPRAFRLVRRACKPPWLPDYYAPTKARPFGCPASPEAQSLHRYASTRAATAVCSLVTGISGWQFPRGCEARMQNPNDSWARLAR